MNADDLKKITDASQGFAGRFFFDAERGDLAFIAKDCDDRQCDCEEKLNSDGDQDCSVCIGDMDHGADTGEPIATLLNAVPSLLEQLAAANAEIERLRGKEDAAVSRTHVLADTLDAIRSQLAAMTKARDEACDLADRLWRDCAKDKNQLAQVTELRKVGQ